MANESIKKNEQLTGENNWHWSMCLKLEILYSINDNRIMFYETE